MSTGADAHNCPRRLGRGAFTNAFNRRILIGRASLTPTTIRILTALQPISPAQNPILRHILTDRAQATEHLPGAIDVIYPPAAVPRTVVVLGVDQILDR